MPFTEEATNVVIPELVAGVLTQGGIDTDEPTALGWLSSRQGLMCVRARNFRKKVTIGPTVADLGQYAVPKEVAEILEVQVNGLVYGTGRHEDVAHSLEHRLWIWGPGGVTAGDYDAGGADLLSLIPAPSEPDQAIELFAACRPGPIVAGDDSTVRIPAEFYDSLIDGAIALGLQRLESRGDIAREYQERFDAGCRDLRKQTNARYRGVGPAQIRVQGYHF